MIRRAQSRCALVLLFTLATVRCTGDLPGSGGGGATAKITPVTSAASRPDAVQDGDPTGLPT